NLEYRDEIKIAELIENFNGMRIEIQKKEKLLQQEKWAYLSSHPSKRLHSFCFDDDDEDYTSAITPDEPVLSTEEPDNSLSMGDEHLDTISTESDEFIKSSVENLIPIPSESEGIPEHMCDVPSHDNSPPLDVLTDQFEDISESNEEFSSIDDDLFSIDNIDYAEASPPDSELVSSEVMEIVIPETKSSSTSLNSLLEETNTFDNSLPEFETFCFDVEEISSGSTTTHLDISLPEYESFYDDHVKEISSGKKWSDFKRVYQMDVKSAFMYGTVEEDVSVCQPPGFEDPDYPDKVYVDDIIFRSTNKDLCKAFEMLMKDKFQMCSMGELTFFLASTPIDTEKPLLKDPDGDDVDVHTYRSMIGSLMYLTSSRPDIMFEVCACARFQVTPKASHLHAVKMIFRYLKGKPHLGLWYPKDSPFNLMAYSDSDYAGASLDRKSTTGGCQFFGCKLISWQCKKQTVIATSSTKAEYVAATSCCAQVLWIQNQLLDYGLIVTAVNDVTRLQALVEKKKVIITEATIHEALRLDDAESIDCLLNEEIFTGLSRMGYGKPSTKLTFYKAFFLPQWKFLIHIILQCMSAKRTSWNEFSSSMASVVICLSISAASVAIDDVLIAVDEPSIPSPTPTTQPPPPSQDLPSTSQVQPTPPPSLIAQPPLPQQQQLQPSQPSHDAEILMDLLRTLLETYATLTRRVKHLEQDKIAQSLEIKKLKQRVKKLERMNKLKIYKLRRLKRVGTAQRVDTSKDTVMDDDVAVVEKDIEIEESAHVQGWQAESQAQIYQRDLEHADKVLSMQDNEVDPARLQEVVEVVTIAKLMTEVVTAASATITAADTPITAATITTAPSAARRRKGVRKEKEDNAVMRYQALKRKPQTEAHARKNMMIYLRNMAGFKMDYFKGMSYEDIRPIFEKYINSNVAFLENTKEQMEEEDSRALKRANLEVLWQLVKERFSSSKPKNFSDDFLLTTLTYMFKKPNVEAQVWKSQRGVYGLEKVKNWKLLESCGVHIITLTTTQMILLVERRYLLTRFTLDQMLNNVRLEVEEESEVSLELLRFVRQQPQEGFRPE
nr:hypothetical protein [Tanacetum cinerariifolium]